MFYIVDNNSLNEFNLYLQEQNLSIVSKEQVKDHTLITLNNKDQFTFMIPFESSDSSTDLIWGRDSTECIVAMENVDDKLVLYTEKNGVVERTERPTKLWITAAKKYTDGFDRLSGDNHFKYIKFYKDVDTFINAKKSSWNFDTYAPMDPSESNMIHYGITMFKGMKVPDLSVLSWDIETTGIKMDKSSHIYMISNTFRRNDKIIRKLFVETPKFVDELEPNVDYIYCATQKELIEKWAEWVMEIDPSLMIGHNIYGYDLPYIAHCAKMCKAKINIGRDGSSLQFDKRESKFRKDGSQFYHYHKATVFGRQTIDTMFLSIKHDIGRQYVNYRLKSIIAHEGLEDENRQHYDAALIGKNIGVKEEWIKITKYAIFDADDALKLFDFMIPPYFYLTPHIPKPFEDIINRASGSQINSFMVRGYLQEGRSLPKASESVAYEGAISIGNPGIYDNVFKVDVASLYPSIMRQWNTFNKDKDPEEYFMKMVEYFTLERLENKRKGKETGDGYYKNLEQAQKIIINSAYGFLGATGLNFNSPDLAAFITKKGREILTTSIDWAEDLGYQLVNADTDSIAFSNGKFIPFEKREALLEDLNSLYPDLIKFEDDGYYDKVVIVKAKNYALYSKESDKVKIKGSALKGTTKEKALQELNKKMLNSLLGLTEETPDQIYMSYVKEAANIKNPSRWVSKKTVTKTVLESDRTNERKVREAIEGRNFSEGDKIYTFFRNDTSIALEDEWDGDYDKSVMMKKIFNTIKTFKTVLDMDKFLNYSLKRHQKAIPHPTLEPIEIEEQDE